MPTAIGAMTSVMAALLIISERSMVATSIGASTATTACRSRPQVNAVRAPNSTPKTMACPPHIR